MGRVLHLVKQPYTVDPGNTRSQPRNPCRVAQKMFVKAEIVWLKHFWPYKWCFSKKAFFSAENLRPAVILVSLIVLDILLQVSPGSFNLLTACFPRKSCVHCAETSQLLLCFEFKPVQLIMNQVSRHLDVLHLWIIWQTAKTNVKLGKIIFILENGFRSPRKYRNYVIV